MERTSRGRGARSLAAFGPLLLLLLAAIWGGIATGSPAAATLPAAPHPSSGLGAVVSLPTGYQPYPAVVDPTTGAVFVPNFGSATVTVLLGGAVAGTVRVGAQPSYAAFDPLNGDVYVPNQGTANVSVLGGTSVVASVPVGSGPVSARFDPANGYVYVTNGRAGTVSVLNGTSVLATVAVGAAPAVATCDAQGHLFVPNEGSSNVSVVTGTAVTATIPAGTDPFTAAFDPTSGDVYVTNLGSANVSVLNATRGLAALPVGLTPLAATPDPATGDVYVPNFGSSNVSVLQGDSVLGSVPVGPEPAYASVDAHNGVVYVADYGTDTVVGITGSSVRGSAAVGIAPYYATYDPSDGFLVFSNEGSSNVSILEPPLPPTYTVNFTESGLAPGTTWSIDLNGTTASSTGPSLLIADLGNGSYPYQVPAVAGYTASPTVGTVPILGANATVSVAFVRNPPTKYAVTFVESGLPSGTTWEVELNGSWQNGTNGSFGFLELVGSYTFVVGAVANYTPTPRGGTIDVLGGPVNQSIVFNATPGSTNRTPPSTGGGAPKFLGLPQTEGYALLAALEVLLVLVVAVLIWRRRRRPTPVAGNAAPAGATR